MANDRDIGDNVHPVPGPRPASSSDGGLAAGAGPRVSLAAGRLSRALHSMAVISQADGAALMLAGEASELRAVGGSTAEGLKLQYAQQAERVGPAHDAVSDGQPVAVNDLESHEEAGYARLARRAAPVRAVLSIPVHVEGDVIGSLNFYRCTPYTWTSRQIAVGEHLAGTAADLLIRLAADSAAGAPGRP